MASAGPAAGKVHPRRVPVERGRGAERDVAAVVHREMPGPRAGRRAERLVPAADHDRLVALPAPARGARARCGVSTSRLVRQLARARDDPVRRHRHRIIEVAILEIEFLLQVRQRVPAAQVVIDRHARVPLGDRVDRPVRAIHPAGAPAPRLLRARCNDSGCRPSPSRPSRAAPEAEAARACR